MIHTDGKPTIAMKESDSMLTELDPEKNYFKETSPIPGDSVSHFLLVEVAGDVERALDLRNNLEKLEYPGVGMTAIFDMEEMAARSYTALVAKRIH